MTKVFSYFLKGGFTEIFDKVVKPYNRCVLRVLFSRQLFDSPKKGKENKVKGDQQLAIHLAAAIGQRVEERKKVVLYGGNYGA